MSCMTLDQWINIIISFFTFLAALAAWRSVGEMQKQRKSSLKPDLAFPEIHFFLYWFNPSRGVPLYWSKKEIDNPNKNVNTYPSTKSYFNVELQCYNIGFGVAKKVEITWDFNIEKFVNLIDSLNDEIFEIGPTGENKLKIYSSKFDYLSIINKKDFESVSSSYSIPTQVMEEPNLFKVPIEYVELYSIYTYLLVEEVSEESFEVESVPDLTVFVNYIDIENDSYDKEFKLTPSMPTIWGRPENKEEWLKAGKVHFEIIENT